MKILRIQGKNLASIAGEFDIDYGSSSAICRDLRNMRSHRCRKIDYSGCYLSGLIQQYAPHHRY